METKDPPEQGASIGHQTWSQDWTLNLDARLVRLREDATQDFLHNTAGHRVAMMLVGGQTREERHGPAHQKTPFSHEGRREVGSCGQ